jgi:hypothetical protein
MAEVEAVAAGGAEVMFNNDQTYTGPRATFSLATREQHYEHALRRLLEMIQPGKHASAKFMRMIIEDALMGNIEEQQDAN